MVLLLLVSIAWASEWCAFKGLLPQNSVYRVGFELAFLGKLPLEKPFLPRERFELRLIPQIVLIATSPVNPLSLAWVACCVCVFYQ